MTAFVHARVRLADVEVVIDGNSKITSANGTYADPRPNAFSLPAASVSAHGYCPGSTTACRASCYVRGLAKHAPDVYEAYRDNAKALANVLGSSLARSRAYAAALGAWIAANAAGDFRWHVSGDVWNVEHARWIAAVCAASPGVRHWIYTRTLDAVPLLVQAPNLAVNVSADRDNYAEARAVAARNGARVAYMATTELEARSIVRELPDGSVVFPDYQLRGRELPDPTEHPYWRGANHRLRVMTCPADFFGQSEAHRCGPCDKCIASTSPRV